MKCSKFNLIIRILQEYDEILNLTIRMLFSFACYNLSEYKKCVFSCRKYIINFLRNPCRNISWHSSVRCGPDLNLSRSSSVEGIVGPRWSQIWCWSTLTKVSERNSFRANMTFSESFQNVYRSQFE